MYFDREEYGNRLRLLREREGLTQEELAEKLSISPSYLRKLEKGLRSCSIDVMVQIADYFHVSEGYLLHGQTNLENRQKLQEVIEILNHIEKRL